MCCATTEAPHGVGEPWHQCLFALQKYQRPCTVCNNNKGELEQEPLKTKQARNLKASMFTGMAQQHHDESLSQNFHNTLIVLTEQNAMQKYQHLYKANTATSHYLLSKVFRAKERIDEEFPDESGEWKNVHGDPTESARKAAKEAAAEKAEKARGAKEAAEGPPRPGSRGGSQQSNSEAGS